MKNTLPKHNKDTTYIAIKRYQRLRQSIEEASKQLRNDTAIAEEENPYIKTRLE